MKTIVVIAATLTLAGCVSAMPVREYEAQEPIRPGGPTPTILVQRVVLGIDKGTPVATLQSGLACGGQRQLTTTSELEPGAEGRYIARAREELERIGYAVVQPPRSGRALFDPGSAESADFALAGVIRKLAWNLCAPYIFAPAMTKGEASIEVEWQLYDRTAKEIVVTLTTGGNGRVDDPASQGALEAVLRAFAAALRNLLSDREVAFFLRARTPP